MRVLQYSVVMKCEMSRKAILSFQNNFPPPFSPMVISLGDDQPKQSVNYEVVRAFASYSVDPGFDPIVESGQKVGIHGFLKISNKFIKIVNKFIYLSILHA